MRLISLTAATSMLVACNNGGANQTISASDSPEASGGADSGGQVAAEGGADSDQDSSVADGGAGPGWDGELAAPTQIASGEASLLGVTSDGWAVFRSEGALRAASLDGSEEVQELSSQPGTVMIRGPVVFNWGNVDWTKRVGDLSVWSQHGGSHEVGSTSNSEALIAVSDSGETLVYPAIASETTIDLMITSSDFAAPEVLLAGVGLGSEETCAPSLGFVGEAFLVGWCPEGSRVATLQRFEQTDEGWEASTIAEDALPTWSADAKGEQIFYRSSDYVGYVAAGHESKRIDAGVGRGQLLPDGSAVLYTVGDQLRRSALPDVNPVPVVTTGYKQPVDFSPDFDLAIYSTTVTYDGGTRRDLRMVSTDALNTRPIVLVSDPVAALGRSSITRDGRYALYLTEMGSSGGTLHVAERDGSEMREVPGVRELVAANDSTLVFSDNASDPDQYPVVADLKVLNLAQESEPRLVESKILDGRAFYLDASREHVVYVRSGVDRDLEADDAKGVFVREIK